jgi:hypothetical protein
LAYALQTQDSLDFCLGYAGWFLQLSNVKPTQDCNAPEASHPVSVLQQVAAFAQLLKIGVPPANFTKIRHYNHKPTSDCTNQKK